MFNYKALSVTIEWRSVVRLLEGQIAPNILHQKLFEKLNFDRILSVFGVEKLEWAI